MTTTETERQPGPRPRALVTGASSGIGAAFARGLAARGQDLVLVARGTAKLEALATELTARHGVKVDVIAADLARTETADAVAAELAARDIAIGTLINNAGFGTHGAFAELDAAREHDEVLVNVYSLVALTRALLPAMIARRSGGIINVASTAAFQPVPYMATYGATKAFVLSFGQALAEEVREQIRSWRRDYVRSSAGRRSSSTASSTLPSRTQFASARDPSSHASPRACNARPGCTKRKSRCLRARFVPTSGRASARCCERTVSHRQAAPGCR
jgi:NADP-dependent 3-hydroxy acid dehydrogenase YdfG